MCFSVNLNIVKEELENRYGAKLIDPDKYRPSYYYHAFSLPAMPVLGAENRRSISLMTWGLIPSWVKSERDAATIRMKTFNARSESIDNKPSFSGSFLSGRCIIPVRGFYEWQHAGTKKISWYIYRTDNDIMSLAGLWSEWVNHSTHEHLRTFTIITTGANSMMEVIHNSKKRMPVILEKESEDLWLDKSTEKEKLFGLLNPSQEGVLEAYTISPLIGRRDAEKNHPDIIKPFDYNSRNTLF